MNFNYARTPSELEKYIDRGRQETVWEMALTFIAICVIVITVWLGAVALVGLPSPSPVQPSELSAPQSLD